MVKEFKEFISRGNMMDLAVGVIIGAAFTAIVNSLVKNLINPLVVFFLIKLVNKITPKKEVEEDPAPTNEEIYLRQIRDLLQEKNK